MVAVVNGRRRKKSCGIESVGCGGGGVDLLGMGEGRVSGSWGKTGSRGSGGIETSEHVNQLNILPRFLFMVS